MTKEDINKEKLYMENKINLNEKEETMLKQMVKIYNNIINTFIEDDCDICYDRNTLFYLCEKLEEATGIEFTNYL